MKRTLAGIVLLAAGGFVFGLSPEELGGILDCSATLETLSAAAAGGEPLSRDGHYVVLTGSVESVTVVDKNPAAFAAEITLVDGRWQGLQSVSLFRCVVEVAGASFVSRIPAPGAPASPDAEIIVPDTPILVIGVVEGVRVLADGTRVPVVSGAYVRNL